MGSLPVRVTIINDPLQKQDCDVGCGTDWASLQVLETARQQIAQRFGDGIQLTYLDLTGDGTERDIAKWIESIKQKNLTVPVLVVNGKIRISGSFDIRQVMDAIEVEMEMGV